MEYIRKYELWSFRQESDADKNKKKLLGVCDNILKIKNGLIFGQKIKNIDIGYSKIKNEFIVKINSTDGHIFKFIFKIDTDFKIIEFNRYEVYFENEILLHSMKRNVDIYNLKKYRELNSIIKIMNDFFKSNGLI
jgi:hypothetical protein